MLARGGKGYSVPPPGGRGGSGAPPVTSSRIVRPCEGTDRGGTSRDQRFRRQHDPADDQRFPAFLLCPSNQHAPRPALPLVEVPVPPLGARQPNHPSTPSMSTLPAASALPPASTSPSPAPPSLPAGSPAKHAPVQRCPRSKSPSLHSARGSPLTHRPPPRARSPLPQRELPPARAPLPPRRAEPRPGHALVQRFPRAKSPSLQSARGSPLTHRPPPGRELAEVVEGARSAGRCQAEAEAALLTAPLLHQGTMVF